MGINSAADRMDHDCAPSDIEVLPLGDNCDGTPALGAR